MDQGNQTPQQETVEHKKEKKTGKTVGLVFLVLVLIAAAGAGGWWYRDQQANETISAKNQEIAAANQKAEDLAKKLDEAKTSEKTTTSLPSEEVRNNIQAAVRSKNYAAMSEYMADKVSVIIAASEGLGSRTPSQAVEDMKYLDSATDPWDFDLSAETLDGYMSGGYGMYMPEGSLVGKSADGKVVSISFNGEGKIVGVFMSASADLLS